MFRIIGSATVSRHELKPEVTAQGHRFISVDHDYWADHPMHELKEKVVQHIKKKREEQRIAERAD